jgi:NhaA family Na+:H+ antiporter
MLATGILAGIGFTMSLFIASLAFVDAGDLATAKISILIASSLAGAAGLFFLSRVTSRG